MGEGELYRSMYMVLFHSFTDAIAAMEEQNFSLAREILIKGQQEAEEVCISEESE